MAGPITHAAIALKARDRLRQVRDRLKAKIDSRVGTDREATDLEKQVHHLAAHAFDSMTVPEPTISPPVRPYMPPAGDRVSQFLFMGAIGPDIAGFASPAVPLQRWLRDTMAKGSPDEHAERVLASSTDFVLKLWAELKIRIPADNVNRQRMRAYLLGHCSHIAASIVLAPYVDALSARRTEAGWARLSEREIAAAIEDRMAQFLLGRDADRQGHDLGSWFPDHLLVPEGFVAAYKAALEAVYGAGAIRPGGSVWETAREATPPPALEDALLRDAYRNFQLMFGRWNGWRLTTWMVQLLPMFLPMLFALPLMAASSPALALRRESVPAGTDEDAGWFDTFGLPLAMASLSPLISMIVLQVSSFGAEGRTAFGWFNAAVQLAAAIGTLATIGTSGSGRWGLLFVSPLVLELIFVIVSISQTSKENPRSWQLAMSGLVHMALAAIFSLLFLAGLHRGAQAVKDGEWGAFAGWMLLWTVLNGILWMIAALAMRFGATPEPSRPDGLSDRLPIALPPGVTAATVTAPANLQMFDDMMLATAPPAADQPTVMLYPSGPRPLLKLFWTGAGAPTIRPRRDRIEFVFGANVQTVYAPAVPTRLADLATLLERVVTDPAGGGTASLRAMLVNQTHAAADDGLLPPGLQFADHGDLAASAADHDRLAEDARELGTDENSAYILNAGPRGERSVRFGRQGASTDLRLTDCAVLGSGTASSGAGPLATQLTIAGGGDLRSLFRKGDFVEIPFGEPTLAGPPPSGALRRQVHSVDSATQLTLTAAFPAAIAAGIYGRVVPRAGQGTITTDAANARTLVAAGNATLPLGRLFRPGDWIEAPFGGDFAARRIVVSVDSDTRLTVATPFPAPLAGAAYGRIARSPSGGEVIPAGWQLRIDEADQLNKRADGLGQDHMPHVYAAAAPAPLTAIGALLAPGDTIEVTVPAALRGPAASPTVPSPQIREVIASIEQGTTAPPGLLPVNLVPLHLPVDYIEPTPAPPPPPLRFATFRRIGGADPADLIRLEASRDDTLLTGEALVNEATDLAVLLQLGMASHLLESDERLPARATAPIDTTQQVFRNWNLDRRRVNEWRMLVLGEAISEKAGAPDRRDPAMAPLPADWRSTSPAGEEFATRMGWLPVFRRWLDMAGRPGQHAAAEESFRPGDPTNAELSRAVAFLLDLAPPA